MDACTHTAVSLNVPPTLFPTFSNSSKSEAKKGTTLVIKAVQEIYYAVCIHNLPKPNPPHDRPLSRNHQ